MVELFIQDSKEQTSVLMRLRKGTERVSFRLSDVNIAICDLVMIEFELELELLFASIFCLEYFLFNKYMQYANLLGIPKI